MFHTWQFEENSSRRDGCLCEEESTRTTKTVDPRQRVLHPIHRNNALLSSLSFSRKFPHILSFWSKCLITVIHPIISNVTGQSEQAHDRGKIRSTLDFCSMERLGKYSNFHVNDRKQEGTMEFCNMNISSAIQRYIHFMLKHTSVGTDI